MVERHVLDSFQGSVTKSQLKAGGCVRNFRIDPFQQRMLFAALRYLAMEGTGSGQPNVSLLAKGKIKLSYNQAAEEVSVYLSSGQKGSRLGEATFTSIGIKTAHKNFMCICIFADGRKKLWHDHPDITDKVKLIQADPLKAKTMAEEAARFNASAYALIKGMKEAGVPSFKRRLGHSVSSNHEPKWKALLRKVLDHTL